MVAVVGGVTQVVIEVEDQERAKRFWTEKLGFELVQDTPYGEERWLEVRTPDKAMVLVLGVRQGERPTPPDPNLPTSKELTARGVQFPQPPVRQPFGWWSLFADPDGNRFALVPREQ